MSGRETFSASPSAAINVSHGGMSLRDYFAGQALPATLIAMANGQHGVNPGKGVMESAAIDSYAMADAMLAQRETRAAEALAVQS